MRRASGHWFLFVAAIAGCHGGSSSVDAPDAAPLLAPALGRGHGATSVVLTPIAGPADGLKRPLDLAFHPVRRDELWVVNAEDDSLTIVRDAPAKSRQSLWRRDTAAGGTMAKPAALAFSEDGTMVVTCGDAPVDGGAGPTLWPAEPDSIGAAGAPEGGAHLDRLPVSPRCAGLARGEGDIFWAVSGLHRAVVKVDFGAPHGAGGTDHSDGKAFVYGLGHVGFLSGVPGHTAYDRGSRKLFLANPQGGGVLWLDTESGVLDTPIQPPGPMAAFFEVDDATFGVFAGGDESGLQRPSGLEIDGEVLFVSDPATGRISAFTLDGALANWLDTGLPEGALAGITMGPEGRLYLVDAVLDRVLRIDPR